MSKFKVIEAWWRDLAKQGYEFKVATSTCQGFPASKNTCNIQRGNLRTLSLVCYSVVKVFLCLVLLLCQSIAIHLDAISI